jgi:hypothetical protein
MKDRDEWPPIFPRHLRTYLTFNLVLAVVMAVVLAVRMELKTGRYAVIDFLLFGFYILILCSIFFGPLGIVEIYLYRRQKGVWDAWRTRSRVDRVRSRSIEERRYWKNAAILARLSRKHKPVDSEISRTGLFARSVNDESVSRAALLMKVADAFERSGKREAADRCYLEIAQRFTCAPEVSEAARRLRRATN